MLWSTSLLCQIAAFLVPDTCAVVANSLWAGFCVHAAEHQNSKPLIADTTSHRLHASIQAGSSASA